MFMERESPGFLVGLDNCMGEGVESYCLRGTGFGASLTGELCIKPGLTGAGCDGNASGFDGDAIGGDVGPVRLLIGDGLPPGGPICRECPSCIGGEQYRSGGPLP